MMKKIGVGLIIASLLILSNPIRANAINEEPTPTPSPEVSPSPSPEPSPSPSPEASPSPSPAMTEEELIQQEQLMLEKMGMPAETPEPSPSPEAAGVNIGKVSTIALGVAGGGIAIGLAVFAFLRGRKKEEKKKPEEKKEEE